MLDLINNLDPLAQALLAAHACVLAYCAGVLA